MTCNHENLDLDSRVRGTYHKGDRGIPRQITREARCEDCGKKVPVDYNIAFVDGDKA